MTRLFIGVGIVLFLIFVWIVTVEVATSMAQQVQNIVDVLP